jgi:S1-C subfamily serine protease
MELPDTIDHLRPSIVKISVVLGRFSKEEVWSGEHDWVEQHDLGTGFWVSEDAHVVTAAHVAREATDLCASTTASDPFIAVGIAPPNRERMAELLPQVVHQGPPGFSGFTADVVDHDVEHDLALLRVQANPFDAEGPALAMIGDERIPHAVRVARLSSERPRDGSAVAASGYPFGEPVLVTNAGVVATAWPVSYDRARGESFGLPLPPPPPEIYLADMEINPGNSGGPAYTISDGCVIGVCSASQGSAAWLPDGSTARIGGDEILHGAHLSVLTPAAYVADLLTRNHITPSLA